MFDCPSGQNIQMRCEGSRFSIMEVEDEHNYIGRGFWPTLPVWSTRNSCSRMSTWRPRPHFEGASAGRLAAPRRRAGHTGANRQAFRRSQRTAASRAHRRTRYLSRLLSLTGSGEIQRPKPRRPPRGPRTSPEIEDLVVRWARENSGCRVRKSLEEEELMMS